MNMLASCNLTIELQVNADTQVNQENIQLLRAINPQAVFIPFNAGGNQQHVDGLAFADQIQKQTGISTIPHLTGRYQTKTTISKLIDKLQRININNLLVLRGDNLKNQDNHNDFAHASDLMAFIKTIAPNLKMLGACYPEGHYQAPDLSTDINNLKFKVDAGCVELVTQIGFDNQLLFSFIKQLRGVGINVPIRVGILPVVNRTQLQKMLALTGVAVPKELARLLNIDDPILFEKAGLAFTQKQIQELLQAGVNYIHLYSLNNPKLLKKIAECKNR